LIMRTLGSCPAGQGIKPGGPDIGESLGGLKSSAKIGKVECSKDAKCKTVVQGRLRKINSVGLVKRNESLVGNT